MRVPSTTFSGGEIGKGLYGRVDLNKYQTGVKKALNFLVDVEGGLIKRRGQYFVGKPKYQDKDAKLIPWRVADNDSYALEFGDLYVRFIRLGGHVLYPGGGFVPHPDSDAVNVGGYLEVPTPYTAAQVRELKFTFANDVVYIFHRNHQPRELRRLGLYDWDLRLMNFDPHESAPTGLAAVYTNTTVTADNYDDEPKPIDYKISATMADGLETKASAKVTVNADLGHRRCKVTLTWAAKAGATRYTIYKGKNGIYGFIGYVETGTLTYEDQNFAPSYDVVPVQDFPGFGPVGEWPRVGEFYKQRMGYAATLSQPQTLWMSRPLFFSALTTSIPLLDDDSIKVPLIGTNRHTINHMLQLKKFIIFTDTAEWVVATANNEALAPGTIDPVPETAYGSDPFLSPIAIGDRILFVQNITGTIRDMGYEFTSNAYKADDLSRLARHLFENKTIIAWNYASHPYNSLYCVTDAGTLPVMTYVREHEIWGWTHCETQGDYLDVACVPEVNQHAAYFQVRRKINGVWTRFIERTEISFTDRIDDMFFVDCGLTYKLPIAFTAFTVVDEETITFTSVGHGLVIGNEIQLEPTKGLIYRGKVTNVAGNNITVGLVRVGDSFKPNPGDTIGYFYKCTNTFSGFSHLASHSGVVALADGKVVRNLTVSAGGVVTLPFTAARAHIGLPYSAEIETLDIDDQQVAGRFIFRSVNEIVLHLKNSRGIYAGATESDQPLSVIEPRNLEGYYDANEALDGAYTITAHVAWGLHCGVRIRSDDPLPAHILNIVPDLNYGN